MRCLHALLTLMQSLIVSKVDYCNSLLVNLVQSVLFSQHDVPTTLCHCCTSYSDCECQNTFSTSFAASSIDVFMAQNCTDTSF